MVFFEDLFNDTSTTVGYFVSSPKEKEKMDRRGNREKERDTEEDEGIKCGTVFGP